MASRKPRAPDADYIKDLIKSVEPKYQQRNDRMLALRERRMMRHAPEIPNVYRKTATEVRLPFIHDMIRRSVAIMSGAFPQPKIVPLKPTQAAQKNSSLREDWLAHAYKKMGYKVYLQFLDALAIDGIGVIKVFLDRHSWAILQDPDEENADYLERLDGEQKKRFPFSWEQIDSTTYYPIGDGTEEVLEITWREDVPSILKKYNLAINRDGAVVKGKLGVVTDRDATPTKVQFTEYWNCTHFAYMVNDTLVKTGQHDYGRPPYFRADAVVTSSKDPADEGISYATPLVSLQDLLDSTYTMEANWMYMQAYPTPILEAINEDVMDLGDKAAVDLKVGEGYVVPVGYKLSFLKLPDMGSEVDKMSTKVKGILDEVSLAPILFASVSAEMSNASMATMIAVAKSIFNPATEGIVEVFNGIGAFLQERIEDLGSPVPIWAQGSGDWLALGPDDVDGYYEVEHDLDTVIPVERMQKAQFMADAYTRGFFPKRQVIEDGYGQHDPEKAIMERQLEDLENSAGLQQYVMTQVLRKIGAMQPPPNPGTPANIPMGMGGPGAVVMPGGSQSPLLPGGATIPPPQPTQEGVPPMGTQAGLPGSM